MPSVIDPETLYVDDLPAIWSPVQWDEPLGHYTLVIYWPLQVAGKQVAPEELKRLTLAALAMRAGGLPPSEA